MKITSVESIPVRVPIRERLAIRAKGGSHSVSPFLLVRIHTDEGVTGLGEVSCTPRWSGEDQVTAAHFIDTILAPLLTGQDPGEIGRLSLALGRALSGNPFTKAALEMALWDILGKAAGLPVYRLLGGKAREFVPTKWSVSGVEPGRAAEIAGWAVEQGFRAMKVKVGIDPAQDVARVRAVRDAIGPGVRLGVDANGAWDARTAVRMIGWLREFDIYFVEQPVPPGDIEEMVEVRRQAGIPVIADESVYTAQDAFTLLRAGGADALSAYVGKSAGIGGARQVAAVAEAARAGCTVGSNLEMGIGSAAMIHLAIATAGITAEEFPCDIIGPMFYTDSLLREALPISGGQARAPEKPGLGIELDEKKVELYRVR
ncbi:MAG TPA: enolase C-terminal domain-like protein [Bryobacteraceae bacterium]|nr:enolase C-terminal domain-like protein [Bryobacteraceae bacterium]